MVLLLNRLRILIVLGSNLLLYVNLLRLFWIIASTPRKEKNSFEGSPLSKHHRTTYALLGPKTLKGQPSLKDSSLGFAQDEALSTAGGWGRNWLSLGCWDKRDSTQLQTLPIFVAPFYTLTHCPCFWILDEAGYVKLSVEWFSGWSLSTVSNLQGLFITTTTPKYSYVSGLVVVF